MLFNTTFPQMRTPECLFRSNLSFSDSPLTVKDWILKEAEKDEVILNPGRKYIKRKLFEEFSLCEIGHNLIKQDDAEQFIEKLDIIYKDLLNELNIDN